GRLVDLSLAAERRLRRQHRDAVRLHRAVAAALAHLLVDEEAPRRIDELALLAAPALLGGAGLLVDQHGDARDLAQAAVDGVERVAVVELGALGEAAPEPFLTGRCRRCPRHLLPRPRLD